jgi:hypothetical protein
MRSFFESQFDAPTLERYRNRYRTWSLETLSGLASGELAPRAVSAYQASYLAAHLQAEGAGPDTVARLLGRQWIEASRTFDRSSTAFVKDCNFVRSVAAGALQSHSTEQQRPAAILATHFRAVLSEASIASLALVIPASVLKALVANKQWALSQALSYARRHFFPSNRFSGLAALLEFADTTLRHNLLEQIFELIEPSATWEKLDDLLPTLGRAMQSCDELRCAVESIDRMEKVEKRAAAISTFAATCAIPFNSWPATQRLIDHALLFSVDDEYTSVEALGLVAHLVPPEHRPGVLKGTARFSQGGRQKVIRAFLATDTPDRIRTAWESLDDDQRWQAEPEIPWHTVPDLAEQESARALELEHEGQKLRMLTCILPYLRGDAREKYGAIAMTTALSLPSDMVDSDTFASLAKAAAMTSPTAVESLMTACDSRAFKILAAAAEHLPAADVAVLASKLTQAAELGFALTKWVAPFADPFERDEIVESTLATAEADDRFEWLLPELALLVTVDQMDRARALTRHMQPWDPQRVSILLTLACRMPDHQRQSYFEEALEIVASLSGDQWV